MSEILIELAKHSPFALLLGWLLWVVSRILERQLEISNAQRSKEIEAGISAGEKELEILALRHDAATRHEEHAQQAAQDQGRLLERISRSLERLVELLAGRSKADS